MEISPMRIFWMLIYSFGFGMLGGALNDINRLLRVILGVRYRKERMKWLYGVKIPVLGRPLKDHGEGRISGVLLSAVIFVQDFLLMLFLGAGAVFINYSFNDGRVRIYTPLLIILGFAFYYFTIGRAVIYFSEFIAFAIRGVFAVILSIFYRPMRIIGIFFVNFIKKIVKNLAKTLENQRKLMYNNNKERNVMNEALKGFVRFR